MGTNLILWKLVGHQPVAIETRHDLQSEVDEQSNVIQDVMENKEYQK